jgi:hypothetical protein
MFTHNGKPAAIAPGDVIVIDTATHSVTVRRGADLLVRVPPERDNWPFFCQLIRSREDAEGVASMMAESAGHATLEREHGKDSHAFDVVAHKPPTKKK